MPITSVPVSAAGTLTSTGAFLNTETVVVGGKTYTFQTSLTNVDGNVAIGANQTASHQNLMDAINLTGTPGTQYAAAMTVNPEVRATAATGTTTVVKAKVPGQIGNRIPSTETLTNASWGGAVLAGGSGDVSQALADLLATEQINAQLGQLIRNIDGLPASD